MNGEVVQEKSTAQIYLLLLACFLLINIVGGVLQIMNFHIGLAVTLLALILLPAAVFAQLKKLPVAEALRWRRVPKGIIIRCIFLSLGIWGMATAISYLTTPLIDKIFGAYFREAIEAFMLDNIYSTLPKLGISLVTIVILPGICEESLFRGAVQGTLERLGTRRAIIITALLFGFYHLNPWVFLPAAFIGAVYGYIVVKTGSIIPAMTAHMINNAAAIIFGYIYKDSPDVPYVLLIPLCILAAVSIWEFDRHTRNAEILPSPLTTVYAGIPRLLKRILIAAAVLFVLFTASVSLLFSLLLDIHRMNDQHLAPQINKGDLVFIIDARFQPPKIKAGDIVAVKRDGSTLLLKVKKTDARAVWVEEPSTNGTQVESRIAKQDIDGLAFLVMNPSNMNQVRQIE